MQYPLGFAGTPAFCEGAGFTGMIAWHGVVVGYLITGAADDGGLGIAIFSKSAIDSDYPVFPVEKNVGVALRLKKRAEFGKGHNDFFFVNGSFPYTAMICQNCQELAVIDRM